jgi:hypothetical protein
VQIADPQYLPLKTGKAATGPSDAPNGPDGQPRPNTTVRLYQLKYLFGAAQVIPGPSGVNAVTFLLLVEAQKLLWNGLLDFVTKAVAAAGGAASTPTPQAGGSSQQSGGGATAAPGAPAAGTSVTDNDNLTTFTNSPVTTAVAAMQQQAGVDVPTYVAGLTPSAQQALLRDYCGVRSAVGGWHDSGYKAPHAGGGAFDIEYLGSPWIPLKGAVDKVFHGDPVSGKGAPYAKEQIYDKCLEVWNRACNRFVGHDTTAVCQCYPIANSADTALTTTTVDAIWELDACVRQYFAQTGDATVDADRILVGPGMVINSSSFNPKTKTFSGDYSRATNLGATNPPGLYSGGIVGFHRVVVKMIHQAKIKNPSSVTRLLTWSVFGFGSDLMHFDICHNPGKSIPPITEVTACAQVVDAFGTKSDGSNPWCPTPA